MFKWFKKKEKLTTFIIVTDAGTKTTEVKNIYTIVTTEDQANEYIRKRLILDNQEHYGMWCDLHGYDPESEDIIEKYISTILTEKDYKYGMLDVGYTKEKLAAILRIASTCIPVGCSYDLDEEWQSLVDKVAKLKNNEKTVDLSK